MKTIKEGNTNRLRALPYQKHANGENISTEMNIQANRLTRANCPIGTIFCCDRLEIRSTTGSGKTAEKTFMAAIGVLTPINYELDDLKPNQEMLDDYNVYVKSIAKEDAQEEKSTNKKTNANTKAKTLIERIRTEKQFEKPTIEKDGFFIDDEKWETIVSFIYNHDNLLITGPSGTGKTEVVMLACKKLGLSYKKYNMATMDDPQSAMIGVHRIKDGKSVFDKAQFLEDIQKPGVIFLDELNRAPLTALNYLFSCTDGSRSLRNDYVSPAEVVNVHPECTFIATANIGSEFVGTNIIDPALDSRFFRMEMNYPTTMQEINVLRAKYGINASDATNIALVANDIRILYKKGELSKTITVRQSLMAAKFVSMGYTALEAIERIYLPYFEGNDSEGERSIVRKLICQR